MAPSTKAPTKNGLLKPPSTASPAAMQRTPSGTLIVPRPHEKIYLFVPNLIGYARIVLALASLVYMGRHPKYCTVLYCISCLLDAFDGMAARALGQSTKFGAVLDMITDRCTTSCLLCFLTAEYPQWKMLFQLLIALDFSSHYLHMYSSVQGGASSHKAVSKQQSKWMWYYYHNTNVLFVVCAANELFFVALYLIKSNVSPLGIQPTTLLAPVLGTQGAYTYVAQALLGHRGPVAQWILGGIPEVTWPHLLAMTTFPICAFKQFINVVQLRRAATALVDADVAARYEARQAQQRKLASTITSS